MKISISESCDNYLLSLDIEFDPSEPADRKSTEALIDKFFQKSTSTQPQE